MKMKYIGLQSSIWANRMKTTFLVILFPIFLFFLFILAFAIEAISRGVEMNNSFVRDYIFQSSGTALAMVSPVIVIWFIIAFSIHRKLIFKFSGAKPIDRKTHPEIYNIVENLCMSKGLPIPNIGILEDDSLNAFATGWKPGKSWIVFSRGILNKLNKAEIEAVAAHELTHIMNKDTLLMVCVVVFIGILGTLGQVLIRSAGRVGKSDSNESGKAALAIFLIGLGLIILGYLVFPLIRLAISRKREFLADAGSVELTKDNMAMISALQKISQDSRIESIKKDTVAAMCIESPFDETKRQKKAKWIRNLLSTHPSIEDRVAALKGY